MPDIDGIGELVKYNFTFNTYDMMEEFNVSKKTILISSVMNTNKQAYWIIPCCHQPVGLYRAWQPNVFR